MEPSNEPHPIEIDSGGVLESLEKASATSLDRATIERRATHGIGLLVGQMFALQVLTLGATIVLARILSIADYGVFAVALAVQQAGLALVELGVPAALLNRDSDPNPHEQRAVTGFVLSAATCVWLAAALVGYVLLPATGSTGYVIQLAAIACTALPILAIRTVPMVLLERKLRYGRVTALHTADAIVFNLAALGAGLAGWGGYALVGGVPAGALAGTIAALALQRSARGVAWDFSVVRPMLSFGSQVSARQGIVLLRDLGLVGVITVIGGQTASGYFAMSQRILGVPQAFSLALGRVGFPAMARADGDPVRIATAARLVSVSSTAIGLPLALCAGAAEPLLDILFGSRWIPASEIVIPSAAGLLLTAGTGMIVSSLFFSLERAGVPLMSSILEAITLCTVAAILVGWNSTFGIGLSVFTGSVVAVTVLTVRAPREIRASLLPVVRALSIATAATIAGLLSPGGNSFLGLIAASCSITVVWFILTAVFSMREFRSILDLARKALRRD